MYTICDSGTTNSLGVAEHGPHGRRAGRIVGFGRVDRVAEVDDGRRRLADARRGRPDAVGYPRRRRVLEVMEILVVLLLRRSAVGYGGVVRRTNAVVRRRFRRLLLLLVLMLEMVVLMR